MEEVLTRHHTAALIAFGQLCFLVMMAACIAIEPSRVAVKRGLSLYGNHLQTVVPYSIGFALCVALTALAVARLSPSNVSGRRLRIALALLIGLMALIPLTPYSVDLVFDYLHIGITASLFTAGLVLGSWLAIRVLRRRLAYGALTTQVAAGVLALTAELGWHDYMIPGELAFQTSLALLVVLGTVVLGTTRRAPLASKGSRAAP